MDDLHITYDNGQMTIHLNQFFPCEQARFKKLLKIIKLDWEHEAELKEKLKVYFQNRIPNLPKEAEELNRKAAEYRKEAAKCKEEKKAKRKAGIAPDSLKSLDIAYSNNIFYAKEAENKAKYLIHSKVRFEKYLELL